jgi:RNA polymerase sigma-70 factor (sigma-E family)
VRRAWERRSPLAFEQFVAENADSLLRLAYLLTGNRAEGEDLVQECLMRMARRWARLGRAAHPAAYARRVLVNAALDGAVRRARRSAELSAREPTTTSSEEAAIDSLGERSELIAALELLPARQRAVLVLRYFNDMTETEVAETLGCTTGTVKSTASRGLERLRQVIELSST